jgi:CYTH domain-containing protein
LRLRRETPLEGAPLIWKLARKYGSTAPGVEPITNLYLTAAEHAVLAALPGADLVKRRQQVWIGDVRWAVDVFGGGLTGQIIAEVEASDPAALWAVRSPAWCGREITGDPAYAGAALARMGWPTP